jgi:two-component system, NtrC family, sensor histidine kinase KinB
MKLSVRTKFIFVIILFFVIIAVLSILSVFQMNMLSEKIDTILKENHFSITYARDMSEGLTSINQEITNSFLVNKSPDSVFINRKIDSFNKSLQLEKKNITEKGEDNIVANIESEYKEYLGLITRLLNIPESQDLVLHLQSNFASIQQQLMFLSQMNEKALELKTKDAKVSANKSKSLITVLGTIFFLITLSFTYSFATYFHERFSILYKGIKEINLSNYSQRLYFDGKDEFYDISLVFNEMAEELNKNNEKSALALDIKSEKNMWSKEIQELKQLLVRMNDIEEQAVELISKLESKKE